MPRARIVIVVALAGVVAAALSFGLSRPAARGRVVMPHVTGLVRRVQRPAGTAAVALPPTLPARVLSVPILMYHRIDVLRPSLAPITRALTVSPADFARQMAWLAAHGYHTVSQRQLFDALEHGGHLQPKPVMLTFDDGYRDVLTYAGPIIARRHMQGTAYVITGRISGSDPSFLTWGQLRRLERDGIAIGSHTVHHVELTSVSPAVALTELVESRRALERGLHHAVQWLSYPAGRENAEVTFLARRAGYVLAVTTQPGQRQDARRPLELERYEVLDTTGVSGLASLLSSTGG